MFACARVLGSATPQHSVSLAPPGFRSGGATLRLCNGTTTMQTQIAIAPTAPVGYPLVHRIVAPAIIACALGLTAAWIFFLGYGLVRLVDLAF